MNTNSLNISSCQNQLIDELVQRTLEQNKDIQGIKNPDPLKIEAYQNSLQKMAKMRGQKLWYPYLGTGRGQGPFVELADGSVKYDCICGIGPHIYGHSHPAIIRKNIESALQDTLMQGNLQQNLDSSKALETLLELSGMDHGFVSTSGAMACENALKIAFQKKSPAYRVLAFEHCFMGRTLALSQVTDKAAGRLGLPQTLHVDYLPYYDHNNPQESLEKTLSLIDLYTQRYPSQHACLTIELVQGEGGLRAANTSWLQEVLKKARSLGLIVIVDEVQTFLRTSQPFAYQHFEISDLVDIVTIGKTSQLCATLFRSDLNPKPGLLSQTFTSSTAALRACCEIIRLMKEKEHFGPQGRNNELHAYWSHLIEAIRLRHPNWISGPYGIGLMMAFTPFNGDSAKAESFSHNLFKEGVICFLAGDNPKRARFLIPGLVFEKHHLDEVAFCIEKALEKTAAT